MFCVGDPKQAIYRFRGADVGTYVDARAAIKASESAPVETEVVEAYDAFLEGWEHYRRKTSEDTVAAIQLFKSAIELDPEYGRAYAGLAASYWHLINHWTSNALGVSWQNAIDLAKDYLVPALARPTSTAHLVSADILTYEGSIEEALGEIDKAIALEPNNADSYVSRAQALIQSVGPPRQSGALAWLCG